MTASRNASRFPVALAIVASTATPAFAAHNTNDAPPPLPMVQSVMPLGIVRQNPAVNARDNAESALFKGKSIWTFGDTSMSVPGTRNKYLGRQLAFLDDQPRRLRRHRARSRSRRLDRRAARIPAVFPGRGEVQLHARQGALHGEAVRCGARVVGPAGRAGRSAQPLVAVLRRNPARQRPAGLEDRGRRHRRHDAGRKGHASHPKPGFDRCRN